MESRRFWACRGYTPGCQVVCPTHGTPTRRPFRSRVGWAYQRAGASSSWRVVVLTMSGRCAPGMWSTQFVVVSMSIPLSWLHACVGCTLRIW